MKKVLKTFLLAFMALSAVCLTGCEKENDGNDGNGNGNGNGNDPQTVQLAGTSWVGKYNDKYQGYPAKLTWSLDFADETSGEFFFELVVAGQEQTNQSIAFTYTFDGREGTMNAGEMGTSIFTYDPATNTITMNLMVEVSNDGSTLGGVTTFYLRGQEPTDDDDPITDTIDDDVTPGEITDQFPADTRWSASQNTVYHTEELGDLPMTLDYILTFNNDHIATINVTATVLGQTSDPQTVRFNWTFDDATNTGTLTTKGVPMSFSYNPDNNTIVTEFSFDPNGSGTVGGTTVFNRLEDKALIVRL
ncbi:MAG: hypothetical protein IJR26_11100 [Bacteroidales bacterium]|nr:hypothetical protein [Bacteroidales bacterium]